jgi:hypothetical protein
MPGPCSNSAVRWYQRLYHVAPGFGAVCRAAPLTRYGPDAGGASVSLRTIGL